MSGNLGEMQDLKQYAWDRHHSIYLWRVTTNKEQGKKALQIENYRITGKGGGVKWKSDKNCQEKGLGVREASGRVNERGKNMDLLIRLDFLLKKKELITWIKRGRGVWSWFQNSII